MEISRFLNFLLFIPLNFRNTTIKVLAELSRRNYARPMFIENAWAPNEMSFKKLTFFSLTNRT